MKPPPITQGAWDIPRRDHVEKRLLVASGEQVVARCDEGWQTKKNATRNKDEMQIELEANQRAIAQLPSLMHALHDLLNAKSPEEKNQAQADAREALILAGWAES